ncbi:MAG TPA: hypothetical protein VGD59_11220 [Acidisarcina sp.]
MPGVLSPDELKRYTDLQDYFNVPSSARRLDDYAKWIFTAVTLVATLATGFALFGAQTLSPAGRVAYGVAMLFVGLSLGCAVMILTPAFPTLRLGSPGDLNDKFSITIRARRKWTLGAAACLSLAFIAAGTVPGISALHQAPPAPIHPLSSFSYSFLANKLTVAIHLDRLQPASPVTLEIDSLLPDPVQPAPAKPAPGPPPLVPPKKQLIFIDHLLADEHGRADRSIALEKSAFAPLSITYSGTLDTGKPFSTSESLQLASP